jgi:hypothetical protein
MHTILQWVRDLPLSAWVAESPSIWGYPTILTVHVLSMGMLVGTAAILAFRLLGWFGDDAPMEGVGKLFTLIKINFAINLASGSMLFMGAATDRGVQPIFYVKLVCVMTALYFTLRMRKSFFVPAGATEAAVVPTENHRLGYTVLTLWTFSIIAGRLIAYVGAA